MTILQKQCLLAFLGHYPAGSVDGIWGPKSETAVEAFRRSAGLEIYGGFDAEAEEKLIQAVFRKAEESRQEETGWWADIRYFRREEFRCRCGKCGGFPAEPQKKLVLLADRLRSGLDTAVMVSSGVRCSAHNKKVGGVADSRHLTGKAMDFCAAGKTARQILSCIRKMDGIRYAYAIDGRYVHMDIA